MECVGLTPTKIPMKQKQQIIFPRRVREYEPKKNLKSWTDVISEKKKKNRIIDIIEKMRIQTMRYYKSQKLL